MKYIRYIEIINTILHPVFTSAVRDGYIRSNPSDGVMADIKKSHTWEKPKRHALTEQQQTKFVEFTTQSYQYKHWLPLFTVLLGTGGRIGEILGLRREDCDFQGNIININHTLIYDISDINNLVKSMQNRKAENMLDFLSEKHSKLSLLKEDRICDPLNALILRVEEKTRSKQ